MNKNTDNESYWQLLSDITSIYEKARATFVRMYSIDQISVRLKRSNYVTLISITEDTKRKIPEERAIRERPKYDELWKLVGKGLAEVF